jgi:hypothetical protein
VDFFHLWQHCVFKRIPEFYSLNEVLNMLKAVLMTLLVAGLFFSAGSQPYMATDSCCTYSKVADSLFTLANSPSPMRHFAALYHHTTIVIAGHAMALPPAGRAFLEREVYGFYTAVRRANNQYLQHYEPPSGSWQFYFSDTVQAPVFFYLAGLNAHINGDSYHTLKSTYSAEELRLFKPVYKQLDPVLMKVSDSLYTMFRHVKAFDRAHKLSLGGSQLYVRHLLRNWRRQQFRIAQAWYANPIRYNRLAGKAAKRKAKWDAFTSKYFGEQR